MQLAALNNIRKEGSSSSQVSSSIGVQVQKVFKYFLNLLEWKHSFNINLFQRNC